MQSTSVVVDTIIGHIRSHVHLIWNIPFGVLFRIKRIALSTTGVE